MKKRNDKDALRTKMNIDQHIYVSLSHADRDHVSILKQVIRDAAEAEAQIDEIVKKIIEYKPTDREPADRQVSPPALGESLLVLFCPASLADAVLGDLAEQFESEVQKKGIKRARLLYWARAIRSFGPLLVSKLRNTGIWLSVIEIGRRWIGS
jgi:hypothetical protein